MCYFWRAAHNADGGEMLLLLLGVINRSGRIDFDLLVRPAHDVNVNARAESAKNFKSHTLQDYHAKRKADKDDESSSECTGEYLVLGTSLVLVRVILLYNIQTLGLKFNKRFD